MSWTTLTLEKEDLEGVAEVESGDLSSGRFDEDLLSDRRLKAARGLVRDEVTLHREIGPTIRQYGTEDAFFDAAAGSAKLQPRLKRMLAYALLFLVTGERAVGPESKMALRAQSFRRLFERATGAFVRQAVPVLFDGKDRPTTRVATSHAISSNTTWN